MTERFLTLSDDNGSASASGELGQKIGRSNDNKQVISRRHCGSPHSISGHNLSQSSIPSGHVQQWLEQAAQFRAEIDAQEPNQELRPESLKDKIMVEWLDLDPDRLADEVQVEQGAYIRWETLAHYAKQHRNAAFEAFAGYIGIAHHGSAGVCVSERLDGISRRPAEGARDRCRSVLGSVA